ncbi:hypothetical protein [Frigidibacter sp. SD6-1]|uniref:hypothetical protein n=1 Tax=Frigidibacter sp. SD6-1 TaxID=3032581 RepID=UPI0024DF4BFB|nr:hypothetical protein [Frigidibacter sp. SD6-1]
MHYFLCQFTAAKEGERRRSKDMCLCGIRASSIQKAWQLVCAAMAGGRSEIHSIIFLGPPQDFDGDAAVFGVSASDLLQALDDKHHIAFSNLVPSGEFE